MSNGNNNNKVNNNNNTYIACVANVPMAGMNVTIEVIWHYSGPIYLAPMWSVNTSDWSSGPTAQCPYMLLPRSSGIWVLLNMEYGMGNGMGPACTAQGDGP